MKILICLEAILLSVFIIAFFITPLIKILVDKSVNNEPVGNLYIINDEIDGPQLFLEINDASIDYIRKQKWVKLNVVDKDARK